MDMRGGLITVKEMVAWKRTGSYDGGVDPVATPTAPHVQAPAIRLPRAAPPTPAITPAGTSKPPTLSQPAPHNLSPQKTPTAGSPRTASPPPHPSTLPPPPRGATHMRRVDSDGAWRDLGSIDLSRDMHTVLNVLLERGAPVNVDTVRDLRQKFGVRFDVYTHRARLDAARSRTGMIPDADVSSWHLDEIMAEERASRKRIRGTKPTGCPNIGSKRARQAARERKAAEAQSAPRRHQ